MEDNIKISDNIRIRNPCSNVLYENAYCGPVNKFNFKGQGLNQLSNYEKLQVSLTAINMPLTYIWAGSDFINQRTRTNFVAKDEEDNIYWYKYEGPSRGSGQNYLYLFGNKIKLSLWLSWDNSHRIEYINNIKNKLF